MKVSYVGWFRSNARLIISLFLIIGSNSTWSSHQLGFYRSAEFQMLPTHYRGSSQVSTRSEDFVCYAGNKEDNRGLNCSFTYEVLGIKEPEGVEDIIKNNGGHSHNEDTRPLIYPIGSQLIYDGIDYDDNPLRVQSITEGKLEEEAIPVTYQLPDTAGKIVTESNLILPPGWFCLSNCYTDNSWRWVRVIDIGSDDSDDSDEKFVELPANSEIYIRCPYTSQSADCRIDSPAADNKHPRMFYGKPEFISRLIIFASYYQHLAFKTDQSKLQKLRFTDMSLPRGGLFDLIIPDVATPWTPPHKSHRTGEDADVSYRVDDGDGNFMEVDQTLITKAVRYAGQHRYDEGKDECTGKEAWKCIHIDYVD